MRLSLEREESRSVSGLEQMDHEARVAYESLGDQEIAELVDCDPKYFLPRLEALGLRWPR